MTAPHPPDPLLRAMSPTGSDPTAEDLYRSSFERSLIGMVLLDADEGYIAINDAMCRMLGRSREWILQHTYMDYTHPDDLARDASITRGLREGAFDHTQVDKRYVHADGRVIHALVSKSVTRGEDGEIQHFHIQAVDVTEQREEQERSRRRARQQAAVSSISQRALDGAQLPEMLDECVVAVQDALKVADVGLGEILPDGHMIVRAAQGFPVGAVLDVEPATSQIGLTIAGGRSVLMTDVASEDRFDPAVARRNGWASAATVPIGGPDGKPFGVLFAMSEETSRFDAEDVAFLQSLATVVAGVLNREAVERRLRHLSLHDPLTGLPNRALLVDRLNHALARGRRSDRVLAVMFLDVDRFKAINDVYGHEAGDLLLREITSRLRRTRRIGDTLARFGGDEFVVLCEDLAEEADAMALADRMLEVCRKPLRLGGDEEHQVTVSIGVAVAGPEHDGDGAALIRDADIAMYRAKQSRGRVELFEDEARSRVVEHLRTTNELRRAIDEGELAMAYQPVVTLADGAVRAVESLVRWRHPERGLVAPADFVPVAEETGLIVPLGAWVLDEVVRQIAEWTSHGDPRLAQVRVGVNLSARQLSERGLPEQVAEALERHGVSADRLVCEITETALLGDPLRAAENVEALATLGAHVWLDDFGTGYSALEHLKRYTLAGIKLDRLFVADVAASPVDAAVVRALVGLADALDLGTIAEGIETPAQLERLRGLGCHQAQGYLFSKPLFADEARDFVLGLPAGRVALGDLAA